MSRIALSMVGPIVVVLLWHWVVSLDLITGLVLPSPKAVGEAGFRLLLVDGDLGRDIVATVIRTVSALMIATVIGLPLGLAMGLMPRLHASMVFLIDFFRSIPPIALFPIFIFAFGLGEAPMIAVPVYGCALVILVSGLYGILSSSGGRREVSRAFGFTPWREFTQIVLPNALPQIAGGLRVALSLAMVLTIVVEMLLGTTGGLGRRIYDFHLLFKTPEMYFVIILVGLLGYALNVLFVLVARKIIWWGEI